MKTAVTCLMTTAFILTGGALAAEPTNFEELKAYVGKVAGTYDTYKMDMTMTANTQGMEINFTGQVIGKGEEVKMDVDMDMMGQIMKMTMITDADNMMHMLIDAAGQKQAMKMDMNVMKEIAEEMGVPESLLNQNAMGNMGNPKMMLDQFGDFYDVTFKGKEKLGDEDVYVVSAVLNEKTIESMSKNPAMAEGVAMAKGMATTVYVSAKDGFVRKTVQGDPEMPTNTMTYSNIELNTEIPDDTFVLQVPDGMQVMDMTEMLKMQLGNL